MRDDPTRDGASTGKGEEENTAEHAKAKARAAAGDHDRGLAPPPEQPAEQADGSPLDSGETARGVKGDSAQ
jgi:hypothetical protein